MVNSFIKFKKFLNGKMRIASVAMLLLGCSGHNSEKVDIYSALMNRVGMIHDDPKLEEKTVLANCSIEGRPATFGIVTFSYNLLNLGGGNKREQFGPMYVAAREDENGNIVTFIANASNNGEVSDIKSKWVDFWGCELKLKPGPIPLTDSEKPPVTVEPSASLTGGTPALPNDAQPSNSGSPADIENTTQTSRQGLPHSILNRDSLTGSERSPNGDRSTPAMRETPSSLPAAPVARDADVSFIYRAPATFPQIEARAGHSGATTLLIKIAADGKIDGISVEESSGFPRLDRAAIASAERSRFSPRIHDGKPVESFARIPYNFHK